MERLVLRELKDDYEEIRVSVTQLQNYISPFKYPIKCPIEQAEVFEYGDIVEEIRQETVKQNSAEDAKKYGYIIAKEKTDYINSKEWKRDKKKEFLWLAKNTKSIVDICIKNDLRLPDRDKFNYRDEVVIEASGYLVTLTGEYDAGLIGYYMADCKTAGAKRKEDKIKTRRQKIYYPFIEMYNMEDYTQRYFQYHIFTKHKTMQFQYVESEVTYEEAKDILEKDLYKYLKHLAFQKRLKGAKSKTS